MNVDLETLHALLQDVVSHQRAWKSALIDQLGAQPDWVGDDTYCKHEVGVTNRLVEQAHTLLSQLNCTT